MKGNRKKFIKGQLQKPFGSENGAQSGLTARKAERWIQLLDAEFQLDDGHHSVNSTAIYSVDNLHRFSRLPHNIRVRYIALYTFALDVYVCAGRI